MHVIDEDYELLVDTFGSIDLAAAFIEVVVKGVLQVEGVGSAAEVDVQFGEFFRIELI